MAKATRELLDSLDIDVGSLVDDILSEYVHSPVYVSNPTAFSKKRLTGDWLMCCCPLHPETNPSFGIFLDPPYHCNCFYCGYIGTIDKVIEIAFDLEEGEGITKLLSDYVVEESRKPLNIDALIGDRDDNEIPALDESYLDQYERVIDQKSPEAVSALQYLTGRGLTVKSLNTYDIRVDKNNYIIFPQRTRKGKLRFVQKRPIGKATGARFINEGISVKRDILFGLHLIDKYKFTPDRITRVRLVESPIDVMSNYVVGIPAVALNGKLLFPQQIRELQQAGIETVDVFLDSDKAGRMATKDITKKLISAGFNVNHVLYPQELLKRGEKQDSNTLLQLGMLDRLPVINVSLPIQI